MINDSLTYLLTHIICKEIYDSNNDFIPLYLACNLTIHIIILVNHLKFTSKPFYTLIFSSQIVSMSLLKHFKSDLFLCFYLLLINNI